MKWWKFMLMGMVLVATVTGCQWSSNDKHKPPEGMGSIIINNNTTGKFNVTIEGIVTASSAEANNSMPYDLNPGTYNVTLKQNSGFRSYSGAVSVQLGRLTIMDVTDDPTNTYAYDVAIFLD